MFANVYFLSIVEVLVAMAILFLVRWLALYLLGKSGLEDEQMKEIKKFIGIGMTVVLVVVTAFAIITNMKTALVNDTPRSVIDRSHVNQQQQQFERAARKGSEH
jgi:hypothetical protein